jgi:hypothetical protein
MIRKLLSWLAAVLPIAASSLARAQVHGADVIVKMQSGVIVTGRVDSGVLVYPRRVFTGTFGDIGIPGATFNPGFDSEPGAFTPQLPVGVTIRKALRRWDGTDFHLIPPERLSLIKGSTTITTPSADPSACQVADSLTLGLAGVSGHLHEHPAYNLLDPAGDGVYLLELQAWAGQVGSAVSAPFWILLNQNVSPSIMDQAAAFAEAFLACSADFNRDGALNLADFGAFQTAFALGDPRADLNRDCVLNLADFGAFQTAFALGCP